MIASNIAGAAHTDSSHPSYNPFCLGDVNPEGNFIHVFDETSLNLVMREMDTIADFVRYLEQRENAIRERRVHMAVSEAEMLAYYLSHEDSAGNHHFPLRRGDSGEMMPVSLIAGSYSAYRGSAACKAKTAADRLSYAWDRLITVFSDNVLGGTSVTLDGSDPSPQHAEQALRGMALECRTTRRALADGFIGAMREAERHAQDRFARVILPQKATADPECGYVFLIMAFKARWMVKLGYARYREVQLAMLRTYGDAVLYDHRHLKRVIGIAIDASPLVTKRKGGSEDLMLLERLEWTPEFEREFKERREKLDILKPERLIKSRISTHEYPVPFFGSKPRQATRSGNRHQRRAARSREKKS